MLQTILSRVLSAKRPRVLLAKEASTGVSSDTRGFFSHNQIEAIVRECLVELFENDLSLLQNDVSERAITHKLAEYLQGRFPGLNVDCEYNRNYELGEQASKKLMIAKEHRQRAIRNTLSEDDLLAVSTYPDIIVHRRMTNTHNLLVVEVKKTNSRVEQNHDFDKLKAFTEKDGENTYHYEYGVFILLDTGAEIPAKPTLVWFVDGRRYQPG